MAQLSRIVLIVVPLLVASVGPGAAQTAATAPGVAGTALTNGAPGAVALPAMTAATPSAATASTATTTTAATSAGTSASPAPLRVPPRQAAPGRRRLQQLRTRLHQVSRRIGSCACHRGLRGQSRSSPAPIFPARLNRGQGSFARSGRGRRRKPHRTARAAASPRRRCGRGAAGSRARSAARRPRNETPMPSPAN